MEQFSVTAQHVLFVMVLLFMKENLHLSNVEKMRSKKFAADLNVVLLWKAIMTSKKGIRSNPLLWKRSQDNFLKGVAI
jgi:hypothetical protein